MALLLAQLGRIEHSIEALPALLARLDALTESTRQLEQQWRETARELVQRNDAQQRATSDLALRQSEFAAALGAVSAALQEQKAYHQDIGKRVIALETAALRWDVTARAVETQGGRLLTCERQVETALDAHSALNRRVGLVEGRLGDTEFRTRLEACADELVKMRPDVATAAALVTEFHDWRPWLRGLRWAAGLFGVAIVLAIIAGILWAVAQSGALIP
jgi:chromosome segregation ATPase